MDADEEAQPRDKLRMKLRRLTLGRTQGEAQTEQREEVAGGGESKTTRPKKQEALQTELREARAAASSAQGQKRRLGGLSEKKAMRLKRAVDRRLFGKAGEADRFIAVKKIKRLNSGKRGIGKTHSR